MRTLIDLIASLVGGLSAALLGSGASSIGGSFDSLFAGSSGSLDWVSSPLFWDPLAWSGGAIGGIFGYWTQTLLNSSAGLIA